MFVVQVQYIGENGLEEPVTVTHDGSESGTGFLIGGVFRTWESYQIMRLVDRLIVNPKIGSIDIQRREEKKTPAPSEKTSPPPPQQKNRPRRLLIFVNILVNHIKMLPKQYGKHISITGIVDAMFTLVYDKEWIADMKESRECIVGRLPDTYEDLNEICWLVVELMDNHTDAFRLEE